MTVTHGACSCGAASGHHVLGQAPNPRIYPGHRRRASRSGMAFNVWADRSVCRDSEYRFVIQRQHHNGETIGGASTTVDRAISVAAMYGMPARPSPIRRPVRRAHVTASGKFRRPAADRSESCARARTTRLVWHAAEHEGPGTEQRKAHAQGPEVIVTSRLSAGFPIPNEEKRTFA